MKKFFTILMILCGFLMLSMNSYAESYLNSGQYIGTYDGNDDLAYISSLTDINFNYYSKVDVEDNETLVIEGNFNLIIASDDGYYSGTWATDPISWLVSYYTVKAGPQFALYKVDPAANSGTWSTEHLTVGRSNNQPSISHFGAVANNISVPEPAALILLGLGLLGIAGVRRKMKR